MTLIVFNLIEYVFLLMMYTMTIECYMVVF